jgi:hypothetical protein
VTSGDFKAELNRLDKPESWSLYKREGARPFTYAFPALGQGGSEVGRTLSNESTDDGTFSRFGNMSYCLFVKMFAIVAGVS